MLGFIAHYGNERLPYFVWYSKVGYPTQRWKTYFPAAHAGVNWEMIGGVVSFSKYPLH